jgi:nucleoid-associated protein YgaU
MSIEAIDRLVERFCLWLGRYGNWSRWLDGIYRLVCPSFLDPLSLCGVTGNLTPLSHPFLFMAGAASGQGGSYDTNPAPPTPASPGPGDPGDPPHSVTECAPAIYHGMHGAPCKFHGGSSDNKFCPVGSESGLWWRWNVPGIGNVYYVDCCGIPISTWKVWCRWAKEANWCAGRGKGIYTCTLTLLHSELHKDSSGFADPKYHVLSGPPAPPLPTPPSPTRTYTVVSGDSLSKIAKKFYGDANLWKKIYQSNKALIGPDPNKIYPGQKLTIP